MRIAFLMTGLSGYFAACLEELATHRDTEVLVITEATSPDADFEPEQLKPRGVQIGTFETLPNGRDLTRSLSMFRPDVLAVVGWQVAPYRHVARLLRPRPLRVLCMDNQWLATPKQLLGVVTAPVYIAPFFDVAFLPGDRQASFARKLGFRDSQIWPGLYTCDHPHFSSAFEARRAAKASAIPKAFLFAGRLVSSKGINLLAEAYSTYRSVSEDPWPLWLAGTGPLASRLIGLDGVTLRGFVQPRDLPNVFTQSGCLVLPSLFEPWGVVLHEAAAAGLAVICTRV